MLEPHHVLDLVGLEAMGQTIHEADCCDTSRPCLPVRLPFAEAAGYVEDEDVFGEMPIVFSREM